MPLLFIYGSLLQGESHHARLDGARFLGAARTSPRFTLLDLGEYPALVPGGSDAVHGELWEVDTAHLERLEVFEEHPHVYRRETLVLDDGREVLAYVLPRERAEGRGTRLATGDWRRRG